MTRPLRARPGGAAARRGQGRNAPPAAPLSAAAPPKAAARPPPAPPPNAATERRSSTDFLVLGSGIAGLSYALAVAEHGRVTVVTKGPALEGSTRYAQGGVSAVLDPLDSVENHVRDTLVAGAHLNDPEAVRIVCEEGPARVLELAALGAEFTRDPDGSLHLQREGGHSHRRICHRADTTGEAIAQALHARALAHPNVTLAEHCFALDLELEEEVLPSEIPAEGATPPPACVGARVYDTARGQAWRVEAKVTMLATGGAGHVYPHTTNPAVATGDGIAMAFRAGAALENMEFVQFHPTGLYLGDGVEVAAEAADEGAPKSFLVSEAVRGAGGVLRNQDGERFMLDHDERGELAPRDIVARCIFDEMRRHGDSHVLLDVRHLGRKAILEHFPHIAATCLRHGIDPAAEPIPVAPVQHYVCGGVQTGLAGETAVPGLFACGEVASTGLHGANRLASNSLLEGLVFARRAVAPSVAHARRAGVLGLPSDCDLGGGGGGAVAAVAPGDQALLEACREAVQEVMWREAGIVRSTAGLREAERELRGVEARLRRAGLLAPPDRDWPAATPSPTTVAAAEVGNLLTVAQVIIACALRRKESRGLHYTRDHPASRDSYADKDTVVRSRASRAPGAGRADPGRRPSSASSAVHAGVSSLVSR